MWGRSDKGENSLTRQTGLFPHPGRDALFLSPGGVGIDRRHLQGGIPHPFRQHVERHARTDGMDAVAVPQSLGRTMRPGHELGRVHDGRDVPPGGVARPRPQGTIGMPFAALLATP